MHGGQVKRYREIGVWIWNRFRGRSKWIPWRVNFNITIINGVMIKFTHNNRNHRTGFGRRLLVFEVNCWSVAVPLYWWISLIVTIKGDKMVHLYSKTSWEEIRAMDDEGISLVSNYPIKFANSLLSNAEICNKCLDKFCIIVNVRWRTKMMRDLTWSGQGSWGYNDI